MEGTGRAQGINNINIELCELLCAPLVKNIYTTFRKRPDRV